MNTPVTDERDAMLAAIAADPADDVRRLAFADFLDERDAREDRDRAEFIRVQIRIAQLEREGRGWPQCFRCEKETSWHRFTPRCRGPVCSLRRREYETSKRYCVWRWSIGCPPGSRPFYSRGFVRSVACTPSEFDYYAQCMFESQPVTDVTILNVVRPTNAAVTIIQRGDFPDRLWQKFMPEGSNLVWRSFPSSDAAIAFMSPRCVALGRELAGLPPLAPTQPTDSLVKQ